MSKKYFSNFDIIEYDSKNNNIFRNMVNITNRPILASKIKKHAFIYYPYVLREKQKPWYIANEYYGSEYYYWLVLLSNDIIDPYFEWFLDHDEFHKYIESKYGNIDPLKTGIEYSTTNIKYYKTGTGYYVDEITWNNLVGDQGENKTSITYYDWEKDKNDDRKYIKLIGKQHIDQINKELSELFD